jgi:hypothetical protein
MLVKIISSEGAMRFYQHVLAHDIFSLPKRMYLIRGGEERGAG